jgi:hypothetical protein
MSDTYQSKYTGAEIDERLEWAEEISPHIAKQLNTETGIHGIRYWQDKLEYNDGESWVEIETGSGSVTTKTETQWATENPILEEVEQLKQVVADLTELVLFGGVE